MSFPAPVSPTKVTVTSVREKRSSASNSSCIAGERPSTGPNRRTSPSHEGRPSDLRSLPWGGVDLVRVPDAGRRSTGSPGGRPSALLALGIALVPILAAVDTIDGFNGRG